MKSLYCLSYLLLLAVVYGAEQSVVAVDAKPKVIKVGPKPILVMDRETGKDKREAKSVRFAHVEEEITRSRKLALRTFKRRKTAQSRDFFMFTSMQIMIALRLSVIGGEGASKGELLLENRSQTRSIAYKVKATRNKAFKVAARADIGLLGPGEKRILSCSLLGGESSKCQCRVYYKEFDAGECGDFEAVFEDGKYEMQHTPTLTCKDCVDDDASWMVVSPETPVIRFTDALRVSTELVIQERPDPKLAKHLLHRRAARWQVAAVLFLVEYLLWQLIAMIRPALLF